VNGTSRDKFWQGVADTLRQALITLAKAGGEFAGIACVFGATAWALVRGAAAWNGIWTTSLVTHLRS